MSRLWLDLSYLGWKSKKKSSFPAASYVSRNIGLFGVILGYFPRFCLTSGSVEQTPNLASVFFCHETFIGRLKRQIQIFIRINGLLLGAKVVGFWSSFRYKSGQILWSDKIVWTLHKVSLHFLLTKKKVHFIQGGGGQG